MEKHRQIIVNITPGDPEHPVTNVEWQAIKEVYERVLGAPEQHITVGVDESWKKVIASAIVATAEPAIIDVEAVDEQDPIDASV
jgi:hypothetical protein